MLLGLLSLLLFHDVLSENLCDMCLIRFIESLIKRFQQTVITTAQYVQQFSYFIIFSLLRLFTTVRYNVVKFITNICNFVFLVNRLPNDIIQIYIWVKRKNPDVRYLPR